VAQVEWAWLLGELGYRCVDRWPAGQSWAELGGTYVVLESGLALVAGRQDRMRAGLNHLAFHAGSGIGWRGWRTGRCGTGVDADVPGSAPPCRGTGLLRRLPGEHLRVRGRAGRRSGPGQLRSAAAQLGRSSTTGASQAVTATSELADDSARTSSVGLGRMSHGPTTGSTATESSTGCRGRAPGGGTGSDQVAGDSTAGRRGGRRSGATGIR